MLRAGTAKVDVTPEESMPLWGFSSRTGPSQGAYLPIHLRAVTLEDGTGGGPVAIVSGEFLFWDKQLVERVRRRVLAEHGIDAARLLLNATHTHCGPDVRQEGYAARIEDEVVSLIGLCLEAARPARLRLGRSRCETSVNRRGLDHDGFMYRSLNRYGHNDQEVNVVQIEDAESGALFAFIANYACHPTTIDGYFFGGDYVGFGPKFVEDSLPGVTGLFLQGTAGEIKGWNHAPDNVYKQSYEGGPPRAADFGWRFATAMREALDGPTREIGGRLRIAMKVAQLPLLRGTLEEDGDAPFAGPKRRVARLAQLMLESVDEQGNYFETKPCEVHVLAIGSDFAVVTMNGEICVGIGTRIKTQFLPLDAIVCGYTGPSIGYVPSYALIPQKGYEARTPYSPEMEDYLVGTVMDLAQRLDLPDRRASS